MSTPSPQPLDYDLVSPYAPKHVRDQIASPPPPADEPPAKPWPSAIENENDAKILDEIEAGLRAMIAAEHPMQPGLPLEAPEEPAEASRQQDRLDEQVTPTIDTLEAPSPAEDPRSPEQRYYDTMRVQEVMLQVAQQLTQRHAIETAEPEPEQRIEECQLPPAFLARPMEPIQYDEPWPRKKSTRITPRTSATTLFVRFGFAAGGAAAVIMLALPDLRARFLDAVSEPFAALSSNAGAVFGEGKPAPARNEPVAPVAVRTESVGLAKNSDRFGPATPGLTAPDIAPAMPDQRILANIGNMPAPQRETVMVPMTPPQAAPEQPNRPQGIWPGAPGRAESDNRTNGVASRPLASEEIELLRKMGNDFISAGDFAGARSVLERAADAGDATSALALAATYDAAALARFKVKGLVPDNVKAAYWYERARDLGSPEAPLRLKALARN